MGIKRNYVFKSAEMIQTTKKNIDKMASPESETNELMTAIFDDAAELYSSTTSMASEDLWKKFDLPTPPLSPHHEDDDLDLENIVMPFDIDTEDLLMFDDECSEVLKDVVATFPEGPPGLSPELETCTSLQSNLIQDIMWSAPAKIDNVSTSKVTTQAEKQRLRCNSCSNPVNTTCVAPDEILMETTIAGTMAQTKVHSLGIETPSDSEEEIDVVTVEKHLNQVTIPSVKRKYRSDEDSGSEQYHNSSKTVTLTIEHAPSNVQSVTTKCMSVRQRVECPTDVHNYSLPVTSLKRVHSYPSSPVTHKSKKMRRDISIPSDLKKVAQKLKSSVGISSRNSSDSEEMCDMGKRTQHNVLERKRRTDLKNSFFHLRDSVPELEGQERAPKVVILRKASQYIHRLIEEQKRQDRELEHLRMKREKLKKHLSRLRDY